EDAEKQPIRKRTWELLRRLCESALSHFRELALRNPPGNTTEGTQYLGVQHTLHNLARMAWHHLEAFQQEQIRDGQKNVNLGPLSIRIGFFAHARPVLNMLATVPIPAIADELVKALSGAIDFAAKEVLMVASQSVTNAIALGYATDTFAALTVS